MATSISIQTNTITETSISITMRVSVTYAANYKIRYGITGTGGDPISETYWSGTFYLSAGGSTSQPYKNFTGLMSDQSYRIWCELWNADTNLNLGVEDSVIVRTNAGYRRPENWHWSNVVNDVYAPIVSGGAVPCERNADSNWRAYYLDAIEWNQFLERINEFRLYCGLEEVFLPYVISGTQMMASQANRARDAIAGCPYVDYPAPWPLYPNDKITASWILQLTESLNSIYR